MANDLDEVGGPTETGGRQVNVISKQIPVKVGFGSYLFELALWTTGIGVGLALRARETVPFLQGVEGFGYIAAGALPGLVFLFMKRNARAYFNKLEQRINGTASEIDNYLEQRVVVLQNVVGLLEKAVSLDTNVMKAVASYRSGGRPVSDAGRSEHSEQLDGAFSRIAVAFEAYPDLKAHAVIADAMRQNSHLQKEITAARSLYNDTIAIWNQDIFDWPTKQMVAASQRYTTRIPFSASAAVKEQARGKFF